MQGELSMADVAPVLPTGNACMLVVSFVTIIRMSTTSFPVLTRNSICGHSLIQEVIARYMKVGKH